jgi:pilus assembly protein Flp/PilA
MRRDAALNGLTPLSKFTSKGVLRMLNKIGAFLSEDQGATAAEYAIMISLIALVILVAVAFLGSATRGLFSEAGNEFANF